MEAQWKKLTERDYRRSVWSGGKTTQIAIAPEGASYGDRDFLWRVSSATVETEESDFTLLPDYRRRICALEGTMVLRHGEGAPLRLEPYRIHSFDGAEQTHSAGCCRDFNLMLRRDAAEGEMEALLLEPGQRELPGDPRGGEQILCCVRGACLVTDGAEAAALSEGESLLCSAGTGLRLMTAEEAVLMRCRMREKSSGSA